MLVLSYNYLYNIFVSVKLSNHYTKMKKKITYYLLLVGSKNSAWPRHKRLTSADDLLSSCSPSPTDEGGDEEKALLSSRDKIAVENSKEMSKEKQQSPKESPKLSALVAESPRLSRFRKLELSADPK